MFPQESRPRLKSTLAAPEEVLKRLLTISAALIAVPVIVAGAGVFAALSRGPDTPPVAMHIPNVAFLVPGVRSFVGWEARRDAQRAVRSGQALLLGYLHHDNVGELDGCVVGEHQAGVEVQPVPQWLGYNADGVLAVECEGSPNLISFQVPVLESGNPFEEYQVAYGRAFNNEIVRLMRSAIGGAQDPSDADYIRWRVATWREGYCERDHHADNAAFNASAWRNGDAVERGAMIRDLVCGDTAYGLSRSEVIELLGRPDAIQNPEWPSNRFDDIVAYRVSRARPFQNVEPPAPSGYRRVRDAYDVRVDFDPVTGKVMWFDVLPALEADTGQLPLVFESLP